MKEKAQEYQRKKKKEGKLRKFAVDYVIFDSTNCTFSST